MLNFGPELIYRVPALLLALTIHEYAHAQTAYSLGDQTPKFMGRLSMNPLKHLDPVGAIMLVVVGFGWAKPVAINPYNFSDKKHGMLKVALAGPGSNLLLCFIATFLIYLMNSFGILTQGVYNFLMWTQLYNVWFAFFNLLPIPPLDGSKVLVELLSPKQAYEYSKIEPYSMYILIALLFTGVVSAIVRPLSSAFISFCTAILSIFF